MMNDKRNPEEIESAQEERVDAVRNEAFPDGTNKDEGRDLPVILSSGDLSVRLPYRKIADVSDCRARETGSTAARRSAGKYGTLPGRRCIPLSEENGAAVSCADSIYFKYDIMRYIQWK